MHADPTLWFKGFLIVTSLDFVIGGFFREIVQNVRYSCSFTMLQTVWFSTPSVQLACRAVLRVLDKFKRRDAL